MNQMKEMLDKIKSQSKGKSMASLSVLTEEDRIEMRDILSKVDHTAPLGFIFVNCTNEIVHFIMEIMKKHKASLKDTRVLDFTLQDIVAGIVVNVTEGVVQHIITCDECEEHMGEIILSRLEKEIENNPDDEKLEEVKKRWEV